MEYLCNQCGCDFDCPKTNEDEETVCPECGSTDWDDNPDF